MYLPQLTCHSYIHNIVSLENKYFKNKNKNNDKGVCRTAPDTFTGSVDYLTNLLYFAVVEFSGRVQW